MRGLFSLALPLPCRVCCDGARCALSPTPTPPRPTIHRDVEFVPGRGCDSREQGAAGPLLPWTLNPAASPGNVGLGLLQWASCPLQACWRHESSAPGWGLLSPSRRARRDDLSRQRQGVGIRRRVRAASPHVCPYPLSPSPAFEERASLPDHRFQVNRSRGRGILFKGTGASPLSPCIPNPGGMVMAGTVVPCRREMRRGLIIAAHCCARDALWANARASLGDRTLMGLGSQGTGELRSPVPLKNNLPPPSDRFGQARMIQSTGEGRGGGTDDAGKSLFIGFQCPSVKSVANAFSAPTA